MRPRSEQHRPNFIFALDNSHHLRHQAVETGVGPIGQATKLVVYHLPWRQNPTEIVQQGVHDSLHSRTAALRGGSLRCLMAWAFWSIAYPLLF
jgi:hypothetical protein